MTAEQRYKYKTVRAGHGAAERQGAYRRREWFREGCAPACWAGRPALAPHPGGPPPCLTVEAARGPCCTARPQASLEHPRGGGGHSAVEAPAGSQPTRISVDHVHVIGLTRCPPQNRTPRGGGSGRKGIPRPPAHRPTQPTLTPTQGPRSLLGSRPLVLLHHLQHRLPLVLVGAPCPSVAGRDRSLQPLQFA